MNHPPYFVGGGVPTAQVLFTVGGKVSSLTLAATFLLIPVQHMHTTAAQSAQWRHLALRVARSNNGLRAAELLVSLYQVFLSRSKRVQRPFLLEKVIVN